MVSLLRRIFIKNYKNLNDSKVRSAHGKLATWFGVFSNVLLFILKFVTGLISSSISVIADAINNLSDTGNSVITLIGFNLSEKPADKEHPFGHERIEYISALIVSVIVVAFGFLLVYTSVDEVISYFNGSLEKENLTRTMEIVTSSILGAAIIFKLIQGVFYKKMSDLIHSVALKANAVDSFTDCIGTTVILISKIISLIFELEFLDGFVGIAVSGFLIFNGIKMIKESCNPLIGESVDKDFIQGILKDITSTEGILGIHDAVCHMYGPTKLFMSVHCEVSAHIDILKSHDLIDSIELEIRNKYGIEIVIHMDPVDDKNELTLSYKEKVAQILKNIDNRLTFHDFRAVNGETHTNLLFDIVVPFEFSIDNGSLIKQIEDELNKDSDLKINLVVNVDRPFVK